MKIKRISIRGVRGFNKLRTIEMHDRLTLIYAPNSYGKTSVSEAIEWLLYGITSKVETADTIGEYKGSYRNCHLPESTHAFVGAKFIDNGNVVKFTGILTEDGGIRKLVNGLEINKWPFRHDLEGTPKPFILQHALKYLLLSSPDKRFQGFARILGLEALEQLQKNVVSLCTKPESRIPETAQELIKKLSAMESRLDTVQTLDKLYKSFKKGKSGLANTYKIINYECEERVPSGTPAEDISPQLLKIRKDAVDKIFKGQISLPEYTDHEKENNLAEEKFFLSFITEGLIDRYAKLIALSTIQEIIDHVAFLDLGFDLMEKVPEKCPFCGQNVDSALLKHLRDEHKRLISDKKGKEELLKERTRMLRDLDNFKQRLVSYQDSHIKKGAQLLSLEPSLKKLKHILVPKFGTQYDEVVSAISGAKKFHKQVVGSYDDVVKDLGQVHESIS